MRRPGKLLLFLRLLLCVQQSDLSLHCIYLEGIQTTIVPWCLQAEDRSGTHHCGWRSSTNSRVGNEKSSMEGHEAGNLREKGEEDVKGHPLTYYRSIFIWRGRHISACQEQAVLADSALSRLRSSYAPYMANLESNYP